MNAYHGSREEREDYAMLQADLKRYERVLYEIKALEQDTGAWAAGNLYKEADAYTKKRLSALRKEMVSLEKLCFGEINPRPEDLI